MQDTAPMTVQDIRAALDPLGLPYAIKSCDECGEAAPCARHLSATVIRATDKACAVVLFPEGRRLSAAVRLPRASTAEAHGGWPFGSCCPVATSKRMHVSVWADIGDDSTVCVPAGPGARLSMRYADFVEALKRLGLLGKVARRCDFVN